MHACRSTLEDPTAVEADHPGLRDALLAGLEQAPLQKPLLQALGTHALFGANPREGEALLRRALDQDMFDRELLLAVAKARLLVLEDRDAAGELLAEAKRKVRHHEVAQACFERLSGNVLWRYPQLLQDLRGVIQVGAHCGEEVEAFTLLGLERQAYLEPQPEAFARLERQVRAAGPAGAVVLNVAVGAAPGTRELRVGARGEHASFLRTHPLAKLPPSAAQTRSTSVPVTTLDALVAAGQLDPRGYDLLVVDTEGTELEVLRGATELLRHVDLVCVAVFLDTVYDGAPLPQQIQTFLREVHGGDGFHLRAFEPGPDPARGDAVFRRINIRRARR